MIFPELSIYHSICRKCGKVIKNPQSVKYGMGPVCRGEDPPTRTKINKDNKHPKLLKKGVGEW